MLQPKIVPPKTPPPALAALLIMKQFETETVESQYAPPPESPLRVAPLVSIKPDKVAPLESQAQRIAPSPLVVPGTCQPSMRVTPGPWALRIVTALYVSIRFVTLLGAPCPPPAYTPFVTITSAPGNAMSIASWIFVAAVAQESYGGVGVR